MSAKLKLPGHIAVCVLGTALLAGVPLWLTGGFDRLAGRTDAVSSASVIVDAPSGKFTAFINRDRHKSESDLAAWTEFFSGGEFAIIFDDISCVTLAGDSAALNMAQSFMSRLPENQMKLSTEDSTLAVSKADHGRFDMLLVSDEMAETFGLSSVSENNSVEVIHIDSKGVGE